MAAVAASIPEYFPHVEKGLLFRFFEYQSEDRILSLLFQLLWMQLQVRVLLFGDWK